MPIYGAAVEPWARIALQGSIDGLLLSFNEQHFLHLNLGQTCMASTLDLETQFLEVLNTS